MEKRKKVEQKKKEDVVKSERTRFANWGEKQMQRRELKRLKARNKATQELVNLLNMSPATNSQIDVFIRSLQKAGYENDQIVEIQQQAAERSLWANDKFLEDRVQRTTDTEPAPMIKMCSLPGKQKREKASIARMIAFREQLIDHPLWDVNCKGIYSRRWPDGTVMRIVFKKRTVRLEQQMEKEGKHYWKRIKSGSYKTVGIDEQGGLVGFSSKRTWREDPFHNKKKEAKNESTKKSK